MRAPDWLQEQSRLQPDHVAVIDNRGEKTTFAGLERRTDDIYRRLRAEGIGSGATVFSLLQPELGFVSLLHAVRGLGAILAVGSRKWTEEEVRRAAELARPAIVLADADFASLGRIAATTANARLVLVHGESIDLPVPDAVSPIERVMELTSPYTLLFTSGTSGAAKAIVHSGANYFASTQASSRRLGSHRDDLWLASMPLHHIGGLAILVRSVILGTTIQLQRSFQPETMAQALLSGSVTQASVVPAMLDPLLDAIGGRVVPAALRFVLVGGAVATHEQLARAQLAGLPVAPTYGMTETTSQMATAVPSLQAFRTGEVGMALDTTEIRLVDKQRQEISAGAGALEVRGPTVALGRLSTPGKMDALVDQDGWMPTMDAGIFDHAGVLQILGRLDDVIVTGGENVSPGEVEAALMVHPEVAEVGVVGRKHAKWGMAVTAFVVPASATRPSLEELRAFAGKRLARYKLPQALEYRESLPRTAAGKLQRHELR